MLLLLLALSFSKISIVPHPLELTELPNTFWKLVNGMEIGYATSLKEYGKELSDFISDALYTPTGIRLSVIESSSVKIGIQLGTSDDEEYHLLMDENLVTILAPTRELHFNGFQTLLQLLPAQIYFNRTVQDKIDWVAPCVIVHDKPRFKWRGLMVDVCRHFFDVSTIKSIIDGMSHFKLNSLHFHLTEDQAWRIDLKKYPDLVKYGAKRDASPKMWTQGSELDGTPYGPFSFSEEEVKEIIEYARQRSINVVPEIEMPGHALGLLCGYPQYSCKGGPFKPRCYWGIEEDIICAGNDEAISFLEKILDEIINIFPSSYIHCGGDECHRTRWKECPKCQKRMKDEGLENEDQLQSWFTKHFAKYLENKGRRLIGWDEILRGDLEFPESAVVMSWLGNADKAAKLGHDVVMSPNGYLYLDYPQFPAKDKYEYIAEGYGYYMTTYWIYHYNPTQGIADDLTKHIIGCQGNLWSEYIWERTDLQYKAFPRTLALSEIAWEQNENKNWIRFINDYVAHEQKVLDCLGLVDAGLQFGKLGLWNKGELSNKWVSVEFPLDQALVTNGYIEAAFIYKGGKVTHVRNVKLLFNDAVVATDNHEGIISENPQNPLYPLTTEETCTPDNIKIQAEMMCEDGDDCEGIVYLYRK
ncbi:hypothetical protein M9Y10_039698 [Tritrichomonas musculus]|uniref:beta-N-acetylhexosaminidase n=1 Tax=Tritrichomonas musculus TaxID=1915356 RepID=A0ABR2GQY2_9EUKA